MVRCDAVQRRLRSANPAVYGLGEPPILRRAPLDRARSQLNRRAVAWPLGLGSDQCAHARVPTGRAAINPAVYVAWEGRARPSGARRADCARAHGGRKSAGIGRSSRAPAHRGPMGRNHHSELPIMMLHDGAAQILMFRRNSGRSRMSAGRRNASTENASRGAPVGAGGGLAVVEGVDHV